MTGDLAAWLLADDGPIAEDERRAREATPGTWRYDPTKMHLPDGEEGVFTGPDGPSATCIATTGPGDDPQSMADAGHIARWDPARTLTECAAKREIVEKYRTAVALEATDPEAVALRPAPMILGSVVRALAQPYAGRPGWRDEWALD